ncbi:hypothetical protein [Leptotrichia sp. oral taxon 225]|jgi:hypothetical protein|uniref:hypothetical protein n=1 Tax=Leptotrichia sp. oral taxon 225 TaxID=671213 RepID=UPI0003AD8786|nr:hypothetical protein [Leptotrichia sp. oral taxon 225]ERL26367.1 hypothetical protein HMPREF9108_01047 [Leptotrichia sp. oral taxon 225 str. F0581]
MGNRYFRLLKNIRLGGKNKDIKKRNEGASLVYVLVILSIISAFSINFAYYVRQKKEMVFLKSQKENKVEKNFLIQKENQNVERILNKGILFDGNRVSLDKKERYFDSILKKNGQTIEIKNLVFLPKETESIGNYIIKSVKDSNDNEHYLPLEENKVYSELKVIFARKILNEEILFQEKVEFRRLSSLEVEMKVLESGFL